MIPVRLEGVAKAYAETPVLHDLDLDIAAGERLVVLGPSGCGKTTLLRLIAGLGIPDRGGIALAGTWVAREGRLLVPPERRHLGMVFQDLALWPHLSVRGNIEFGLKAQGLPREERTRRIREVLGLVGLDGLEGRRPGELSGGQRQRVALARALAPRPGLVLMDEPLSSLDPALNRRLRREIVRLQECLGFTLIYVTHAHPEALEIATRILILDQGQATFSGPPTLARHHLTQGKR